MIGKQLTKLMADRHMTAAELSRILDGGRGHWSENAIRKWMKDESVCSVDACIGIAEIFGCSLDYLMTGKEYHPKRTLDSTMVSVEDVLEAIRDYAHYPDAQLHAGDLMTHLEHALKGR